MGPSKMQLFLLVIGVFAVSAFAARPTYTLTAMDWYAKSSFATNVPVATKKDLLVFMDSAGEQMMAIRRRNSEGEYVHVANFTSDFSTAARTNGKWVVILSDGQHVLFSVDANNRVSEPSTIPTLGGYILSDDTFVGYDPVSLDDTNYTIRTYEYNAANNNWTSIPAADLVVTTSVIGSADWRSYQVSDTHLALTDWANETDIKVKIYERQADLSWSLIEEFNVNNTVFPAGSPFYNGVDTVAYAIPVVNIDGGQGIVFLYTKSNGQWSLQNTLTIDSLGFKPQGYLGYKAYFLDADNLLINAFFESYTGPYIDAGRMVMLSRSGSDGVWEPVADFDGSPVYGLGIGVNDHDLLINSFDFGTSALQFHSAPKCFHKPINVTCNSQQVNDCDDLSSAQLYTIHNPECGEVEVNLLGVSLIDNQAIEMQFSFKRELNFGVPTVLCNTTVTCPSSPVALVAPTGKVSSALGGFIGATFLLYLPLLMIQ